MASPADTSDLKPRYCFISRGQKGYGFNLHGEAPNQPGDAAGEENPRKIFYHVIKAVDADSPAEVGGLKQDDRLVGVNGKYVDQRPHNEVVDLIKAGGTSTWLLVVDRDTDAHFFKTLQRRSKFSDAVYGQQDKRGHPVDINEIPMEEELVSEAENVAIDVGGEDEEDSPVAAAGGEQYEQQVNGDSEQTPAAPEPYVPESAEVTPEPMPFEPEDAPTSAAAAAAEPEVQPHRDPSPVPAPPPADVTPQVVTSPVAAPRRDDPFSDMEAARLAAKGSGRKKQEVKNSGGNWNSKWQDFNRL